MNDPLSRSSDRFNFHYSAALPCCHLETSSLKNVLGKILFATRSIPKKAKKSYDPLRIPKQSYDCIYLTQFFGYTYSDKLATKVNK